jgi:hypothetical protein
MYDEHHLWPADQLDEIGCLQAPPQCPPRHDHQPTAGAHRDQLIMLYGLPLTSTTIDHTSWKENQEQHTPPSPASTTAYHTYNSIQAPPPSPLPLTPTTGTDQHYFKSGAIPPPREKPLMPCVSVPSTMEAAPCTRRTAYHP